MQHFRYRAYDKLGKLTDGVVQSASRVSALAQLHANGLFPLDVAETAPRAKVRWWEREVFGGSTISTARLTLLTRELSTLVKADLPVDEALRIVAVQPLLPARVRQTATEIHEDVRGGSSLGGALANRTPPFPEFYWRLIQAGESSGSLAETLEDLATLLERAAEARAKLVSALIYPAVLLVAACAAVAVVMTVLVPTVVPLFKDAGAKLPAALQFLVDVRDFVSERWALVLAAIATIFAVIVAALRNEATREAIDRNLLRVPIVGGLIVARETARFSRTFSTLSRNGLPILEALRLTGNVLRNRAFKQAVSEASERVKSGDRLAEPLIRSGIFPELALRLISVGEQPGQVEAMLMRVATIFETSLQRQVSQLLTLLTPLLTLMIGGTVGGLILTVMNAILSVNDLASP